MQFEKQEKFDNRLKERERKNDEWPTETLKEP